MKKTSLLIATFFMVSACTGAASKVDIPRQEGEFPGNHVALAQCVNTKLEQNRRESTIIMRYITSTIPDYEGTEITGIVDRESKPSGSSSVVFLLTINQIDAGSVRADIRGSETKNWAHASKMGDAAWDYLRECAEERPESQGS